MEETKSKFITQQDVKFIFAIIVFLIPIFFAYSSIETKLALIQQDLNTIRSNDLAHMEISLSDLKSRNAIADDRQTNMEIQILLSNQSVSECTDLSDPVLLMGMVYLVSQSLLTPQRMNQIMTTPPTAQEIYQG